MRTVAILLSLVFSVSLFASTGETRSFRFDGSQRSNTLTLEGTKTHTEYRYEQRARTCYRQVLVGYRNVCRRVRTGSRCTTRNGQRVCTPVYTRRCTRRPVYRSEPYTCYETVRVPYEVFDYYTQANVNFTFAPTPAGINANEQLKVRLNGDDLSTSVNSSGKLILLYDRQETAYMDNGTKFINVQYFIEFVDLEKALAPLRGGIQLAEVKEDALIFNAGEIPQDMSYKFKLNIQKNRFLLSDPVLFSGDLNQGDLEISNMNGRSEVKVNLANLGVKLGKGRYKMSFRTEVNLPMDRILNSRDIPALKYDVNKKLKVKRNGEVRIRAIK